MNPSENPAPNDPRAPMPAEAPQRRQLTAEEVEVLQECARESFWYRCVPLGLGGAIGTKYLIQRGILKPNPYYGSFPKISAALLVAYFAGKISYQGACNDKFLRLENSPIADAIRSKYAAKGGGFLANPASEWDYPTPKQHYDSDAPREQKLSDYYDTSSADMDSTKELHGLDDTYRPSIDNTTVKRKEETSKEFVSYDDLRQKNRDSYEKNLSRKSHAPARLPPPRSEAPQPLDTYSQPISEPSPIGRPTHSSQSPSGIRRNQYGDIIED